jgi:predicted enzyme related to lactoylglutathione lyase
MSFCSGNGLIEQSMYSPSGKSENPVVHLELHTTNLPRAIAFYSKWLGWRTKAIEASSGSYQALEFGGRIGGGGVECGTERPLWLPYVEVESVTDATERAQVLGAEVVLGPREGPVGWRSVVSVPSGADVALWQPKR